MLLLPNLINPHGEVKIKITSLTLGFAKAAFTYRKIISRFCILQIQILSKSLLCGKRKKTMQNQNPPGYRKTVNCFLLPFIVFQWMFCCQYPSAFYLFADQMADYFQTGKEKKKTNPITNKTIFSL